MEANYCTDWLPACVREGVPIRVERGSVTVTAGVGRSWGKPRALFFWEQTACCGRLTDGRGSRRLPRPPGSSRGSSSSSSLGGAQKQKGPQFPAAPSSSWWV